MKVSYSDLLAKVIEERIIESWNKCDQLGYGRKYDDLSDECRKLHYIANELHLNLSEAVKARF